jgi:hypothetical protein
VTLPALPSGWTRHDAGAFLIGVPDAWLVLTVHERDDAAAAALVKTAFPNYTEAVDSAIAQMRAQNLFLFAVDVSGDRSTFATNVNILKVAGPLDEAFVRRSAATVQAQFKLDTPLNVETVATPAGTYRYQFAENLLATSMAGIQYLFPSGSDVYVMTFLTTVAQAATYGPTVVSMADTFAVAASGASPIAAATPAPAVAPLPAGWARYDLGNGLSIGLPEAWMTMTPDPAAEAAIRAKWADQKLWIDTYLPMMRANGELLLSLDVKGPGPANFPAQFSVYKYAGPLTAEWAKDSALHVQQNVKATTPFDVLPVTDPTGAYRYQWVADAAGVSVAGAKYLIPVGSDVYELTLSVSTPLAPSYSPILTSIVESLSPITASAAPVAPAAPAPSLDPSNFDPQTGKFLGESLPDVCALVSLDTVKAAAAEPDTTQSPQQFQNSCDWVYPDKSGLTLYVDRYIDAAHAKAALADEAAHPGMAGHSYTTLSGVGDAAYIMDKNGGDAFAVAGSWLVFVGVGSAGPTTTRTTTAEKILAAAIGNLPR